VSENKVLRRIFRLKREKARGEYIKLNIEELNDFILLTQYCVGDQSEKNEIFIACNTYGEE
jgi:hypothetical protein